MKEITGVNIKIKPKFFKLFRRTDIMNNTERFGIAKKRTKFYCIKI